MSVKMKNISMGKAAYFPSYRTSLVFRFRVKRDKEKAKKLFSVIRSSENSNFQFNKTVKTAVFTTIQTTQWPSLPYTGLER